MSKQILVVEDDRDIANLLKLHLSDLGYNVDLVHDGEQGLEAAGTGRYDLVVLDLMLPGVDGLSICRQLRSSDNPVPILMLTAKSSELDRVMGLELGADDYLTKPFSVIELQARVKAIFRRLDLMQTSHNGTEKPEAVDSRIVINDLMIDPDSRVVMIGDNSIELTATEFDLLLHFATNPGRVYNRAQLLDKVWGYGHAGYEHTVNSHINRLRKKIEKDPAHAEYIQTVWGVGYKFIAEANDRK
jgi:two-component system, OmpR family, response regulator